MHNRQRLLAAIHRKLIVSEAGVLEQWISTVGAQQYGITKTTGIVRRDQARVLPNPVHKSWG